MLQISQIKTIMNKFFVKNTVFYCINHSTLNRIHCLLALGYSHIAAFAIPFRQMLVFQKGDDSNKCACPGMNKNTSSKRLENESDYWHSLRNDYAISCKSFDAQSVSNKRLTDLELRTKIIIASPLY